MSAPVCRPSSYIHETCQYVIKDEVLQTELSFTTVSRLFLWVWIRGRIYTIYQIDFMRGKKDRRIFNVLYKKMLRKIVKHVSGMLEIIWILLNLDNSISYYLIINIENGWFPSLYLTLTLPMCAISRTRHCSRVHCSLSLCCFPLHFVSFHCSPPSNHFILKQISEKVCQFHF